MHHWDDQLPGVVQFPSGRLVRGRGLRHGAVPDEAPDFGLYLLGGPPAPFAWPSRWVRWPDLRLPADPVDARHALLELWRRAEAERVEVACTGGRGRTGTALACLAVLDGVPADDAVAFVRRSYHRRAVETPWQQRYVRRFPVSITALAPRTGRRGAGRPGVATRVDDRHSSP